MAASAPDAERTFIAIKPDGVQRGLVRLFSKEMRDVFLTTLFFSKIDIGW